MHFNFLKKIIRQGIVFFPEAVRDNVVSDDVTITSSLHCDVTIFSIFLVKWVLRMVHAKNYDTMSTFIEVMQKKTVASFSQDTVYIALTHL